MMAESSFLGESSSSLNFNQLSNKYSPLSVLIVLFEIYHVLFVCLLFVFHDDKISKNILATLFHIMKVNGDFLGQKGAIES